MTIPWIAKRADDWLRQYTRLARIGRRLVVEGQMLSANHVEMLDRWWVQRPWYVKVQEWLWRHT